MSIAPRLASNLGRRDEHPNIALAEEAVVSENSTDIAELVDLLASGTKPIRHDAIKVLYEIGTRRPQLIAQHLDGFVALLESKDNRTLWGALSAIDTLGEICAKEIMPHLNLILEAADRSSVIAKDKTMHLLATLNGHADLSPVVEPVLLERLTHAAVNQFPMYAEFAATTVSDAGRAVLINIITKRRANMSYPAKKARLEKLRAKMRKTRPIQA